MQDEIFKYGIVVGRFQHIHIGHEKLINIGLKICEKLLVYITVSDKGENEKNPYTYEYRKSLLEIIYKEEVEKGKLIISPINDLAVLDTNWGKEVLENAKTILSEYPNCIIYGKDKNILKCFPKDMVDNLTEVYVDRNSLAISATKMREYLLENNEQEWKKYTNPKIYNKYKELKNKLEEFYCKKF
ncbi:MAG: adenylyltransferase/cytidyltransferase family protein [Clostridia bacterium]|nr:adenylyltransferase/cytidyltransferase family protein [Clostridia bacterium]